MPVLSQSDRGTENNGVANVQTILRHRMDPTLGETLQHNWRGGKRNIKPEIAWSQMRKEWSPGFEDLLQEGLVNDWYHPDIILERLCFHYIFIPWLQGELDVYVDRINHRTPRYNRKKALPHGKPVDIFENPEKWGSHDYCVLVEQAHIDAVRAEYAPPDHPVFDLVPPEFGRRAKLYFDVHGTPVVTRDNVWAIYLDLLAYFRLLEDLDATQLARFEEADEIAVLNLAPPVVAERPLAIMRGQRGEVALNCRSDLDEGVIVNMDIFTDDEEAYATDN